MAVDMGKALLSGSVKPLPPKEEAFARAYAAQKAKNASKAYRDSRDTSRMKTSTINSNAKKLLRKTPVRLRIAALEAEGTPGEQGLTVKQEAFAQEYVRSGNASEAYRKVYDVSESTKPQVVHNGASALLAHHKVSVRVAEIRKAAEKRAQISVDGLIERYRCLGFTDVTDIFEWGETVVIRDPETNEIVDTRQSVIAKASKDIPPEARAAIAGIKQRKDGSIELMLRDPVRALDSIGKHLGMFEEDNKQRGKAAGEAIAKTMSDFELARYMAFVLEKAAREKQQQKAASAPQAHKPATPAMPPAGTA